MPEVTVIDDREFQPENLWHLASMARAVSQKEDHPSDAFSWFDPWMRVEVALNGHGFDLEIGGKQSFREVIDIFNAHMLATSVGKRVFCRDAGSGANACVAAGKFTEAATRRSYDARKHKARVEEDQ
jgi:hypothetical protein